ncbi:hypothetical protein FFJ24_005840 [Pedobacter sp. KBS0701]|uniref:hypothetical protein n=1 Tax=Pedobacter sp. KBS0701 TaxID=2578106 RepID=UPI00110EE203|nr:hypothetical protein [Pedobacter sp. KBS0701]QDW24368.1 hypothetical protein FFJ24_005840 [Pedobacter sp. KBS0701]
MKKMWLILLSLFVIIIGLNKLTTINLSPRLLIRYNQYKNYPELRNGLNSDKHLLYRATQTSNAEILYFPDKNFVLINNFKKLGYYNPIKIDAKGHKIFELNIDENSQFKFLETINCFAIGADGIYDISADHPAPLPYNEVLNEDNSMQGNQWVEIFEKNYKQSEVVLYGWHTDQASAQCVYFQIAGKWTKLYTSINSSAGGIYADGSEIICKINGKNVPHKWHEAHFLKDAHKGVYSNSLRFKDSYISTYNSDFSFFPDQSLKYKDSGNIKTEAFAKESSTKEGYFNPGIPSTFYGTAYYELNLNDDILHFKSVAYQYNSFGESPQTDLHLFQLPEIFTKNSDICFLAYDYSTNFHDNGKKGIYIIRKK